ncbi:MAG: cupin domain-containing protein [Burkholderiales bacterium]|nr:cupin domain-containing protein [Burkholderiales bacterium]
MVAIDDITRADFQSRRPGLDKAVMHEDGPVQSAVFRVAPGSGVPRHLHSRVYDIFVGIRGLLEIRYEGQHGNGMFELRPGAFCAMPPGVKHEVYNPSADEEAYFFIVHAPHEGYDFVPVEFRHLQASRFDPEAGRASSPSSSGRAGLVADVYAVSNKAMRDAADDA